MDKGTLLQRITDNKPFRVTGKTLLWNDFIIQAEKGPETDLVYPVGETSQAHSLLMGWRYRIVSETFAL